MNDKIAPSLATETPTLAHVSVIIPAYNETRLIGSTVIAARQNLAAFSHEIIVVDNGSTDGTQEVARGLGARVIERKGGTIGRLRNEGVSESSGEILVFLDADVTVSSAWARRFETIVRTLSNERRQLTGAMCVIPEDASWIERHWFAERRGTRSSHIGSGHLITTRAFFDELRGFDETLETGEDADLSERALRVDAKVVNDPLLVAEHHGFPKTVRDFVRREAWHGKSDFASLTRIVHSSVAIASIVFVFFHLILLIGVVSTNWHLSILAAIAIVILCTLSSLYKFRHASLQVLVGNIALFYLYYLGRSFGLTRLGSFGHRLQRN